MSQSSPRLSMPLIQPSQAQKHVTHNEALVLLDGIVQLTLRGTGAETPPASGADGEAWALGAAPTGLWEGQGGRLAIRSNGGWVFASPAEGWRAWDLSAGAPLVHDGTGWTAQAPGLQNAEGIGIGTSSDEVNRLAVASDAVLLGHAGAGMQLKINKATAGDTASLLFQTGWSGRAEMGLAGSDGFEFKVSADGAAWSTGLRVGAGGLLEAPEGLSIGGGAPLSASDAGAWTPVLSAGVPAAGGAQSGTGSFVRIGAMVLARFDVTLADPGTGGSGDLRIEGLPASGAGLALGAFETDVAGWPAGAPGLRLDGAALGPMAAGARVQWGALAAGDRIEGTALYEAA